MSVITEQSKRIIELERRCAELERALNAIATSIDGNVGEFQMKLWAKDAIALAKLDAGGGEG